MPSCSRAMTENRTITVYGASGHTGRFVVSELLRRGWTPVLAGRDPAKLGQGDLEVRAAAVDDPAALDRALAGAAAVINCAGPFFHTAGPVVDAALRAGVPYLDVAAEIEANVDTFARYDGPARSAGVVVVPAMAFFGGLGDLLATAALGDWVATDEITIAYALDSWRPTDGTRASGQVSRQRREGRRVVYTAGRLTYTGDPAPAPEEWDFPPPIGRQPVVPEFTMADSVTIPRHVSVPEIQTYMSLAAVADVTDPDLPALPGGPSSQTFLVDVVARNGAEERRAVAAGRDIYAISAPLVVEAAERVLSGEVDAVGALTAAQAFPAEDFLEALPMEVRVGR